jgi:hypothetical protein
MNNLIKHCRYYKGEDVCPEIVIEKQMANIWSYERMWVENEDFRAENSFNMIGYLEHGLKDFNTEDGTPITLKALLYNRHSHWCGGYGIERDVASFKEWYQNSYIQKS